MLMIIFGAGASYDSLADYMPPHGQSHIDTLRPPLANQLFQRRDVYDPVLAAYPACTPIIERLRRATGTTIEHELEQLKAEAELDERRGVQLNAIKYYLRRILWTTQSSWWGLTNGVNNYAALLDRVAYWQVQSREPVRLVTFNYDTLLELGCQFALGLKFPYMTSYLGANMPRPDYLLFKPHGSINWVRTVKNQVDQSRGEQGVIELGRNLAVNQGYHLAEIGTLTYENRPVFPAIAIPVEKKSDFEFPDDHREALKQAIALVTRLLIIGWRGTEQHFLDLWRQNFPNDLKRVLVVAGDWEQANAVKQQVQAYMQGDYLVSKQSGFSRFVTSPDLDWLLSY